MLIGVWTIASIPVWPVFQAMMSQLGQIQSKLERPVTMVMVSKAPFLAGLSVVLTVCKGASIVFWAQFLFVSDWVTLAAIGIGLLSHHWSVWQRFSPQYNFFFFLCGIYGVLDSNLAILFAVSVGLLTVVFNTYFVGLIMAVFVQFLGLWLWGFSAELLIANFVIWMVVVVAYFGPLGRHLDKAPMTMLTSFQTR